MIVIWLMITRINKLVSMTAVSALCSVSNVVIESDHHKRKGSIFERISIAPVPESG